jgi:16S rRNA (uracil1498-N3)-methyltransferase
MNKEKHEFAIYVQSLDIINNQLTINDEFLYHRIVRILRFNVGDEFILFDKKTNVLFEIIQINKKNLTLQAIKKEDNKIFSPNITVCVSILKKEAFEEAIYFCSELGANVIQPIITQKSNQKKFDSKDLQRYEKIIISAAEQSKNFNLVELKKPLMLADYIGQSYDNKAQKLFFDANGKLLIEIINEVKNNKSLILFIGPEGDLTSEEKELLKNNNFIFCKLTPTILRAQSAVMLSLGIFRSFFNDN